MFADMNAYIVKESHCEIWGRRSAVAEDAVLLRYYIMPTGIYFPATEAEDEGTEILGQVGSCLAVDRA
jgi:hypothetical protein